MKKTIQNIEKFYLRVINKEQFVPGNYISRGDEVVTKSVEFVTRFKDNTEMSFILPPAYNPFVKDRNFIKQIDRYRKIR